VGDHHGAFHRLPAGEKLRLRQDRRTPASGFSTVTATLALGFQPGRTPHAAHSVAVGAAITRGVLPDVSHRVRRVLPVGRVVAASLTAPPPAAVLAVAV